MANDVVHFEIIGPDPARLRGYYGELFGWSFQTEAPVASQVSEPSSYAFHEGATIPGGIGGGSDFTASTIFYVGVEDVTQALAEAVRLGGTAVMGPAANPNGELVVAHFRDPQGNLIGLAGPR
ncbi:VOC family protein [Naasia lichenicola]|uniref:Glyoxalase n=1 Tax=Naasia lichenicola TaxID=2565933 RepID=A0A4S4FF75_9MICO|nr:VOC family protein [Naasia lichenicola]THG28763.1 glyoxalase [Naasia lichenicola]